MGSDLLDDRLSVMKLTDKQWGKLKDLLPDGPKRPDRKGRPWRDKREVLEGILWILKTGAQWSDVVCGKSALTPFWEDVEAKYDPVKDPIRQQNYGSERSLAKFRKRRPSKRP